MTFRRQSSVANLWRGEVSSLQDLPWVVPLVQEKPGSVLLAPLAVGSRLPLAAQQMLTCPSGGGWRQKMRCEELCDSGGKHAVSPPGRGLAPKHPPPPLKAQALSCVHQQQAWARPGRRAIARQCLQLVRARLSGAPGHRL